MNLQAFRHHLARHPFWVYVVIFLLSQLTAGMLAGIFHFMPFERGISTQWTLSITLFLANVLAILLFFLYRPRSITRTSTLAGIRRPKAQRTWLCFALALPVILLVNLFQEVFFPNLPDLVGEQTFKQIMYNPIGMLTVAVLGPLAEELLFRGGVQTDLQLHDSGQGPFVAIGITAAIFALVHLNPAQMPAALVIGVLLGFAYWWTGSLVAPILIHVFNNSFACAMAIFSPDNDSMISFLGGRVGAGIAAVVSLFCLVLVVRKIGQESKKDTEIA